MGDADLLCSLSRCWEHRWQARLRVKLWVGRSRWPVIWRLGGRCGRAVCGARRADPRTGTGNASRQNRTTRVLT
ncbi:hypothetical protein NDU88_003828 [Pleurodeles waltl]|uniref:Uncharacterized protein n=1 Tax=Pleurodeles waltl TaxID=8319 RepID=A0AAV7TS87_PLEWA|nr:hypothetical protein NDU88_003828 [Pleurodeles waltl]